MNPVFLDTVGVLALLDEDDQWHDAAELAYSKLRHDQSVLLTSREVLLECGNAAARRPYRGDIVDLRQALEQSNRLLTVNEMQLAEAWSNYASGRPGSAGIVDTFHSSL